jgi:RHS repeat-associated protein
MLRFRSSDAEARPRPSARFPLLIALLALPALAAVWTAPGRDAPGGGAAPPDTVVLYGPVEFVTLTGLGQTYVEQFSANVPAGTYQAVRVVNGEADGTGRAALLSVELNGVELITEPFDETVASLEVPATFGATNTLQVIVAGAAGAHVDVSAVAVVGGEFIAYGPVVFTRHAGPPQTVTEHFSRPPSAEEPFTLIITNGNPDGSNRVSSGRVWLNGVEVATTSDFNQQVAEIVRSVSLAADNAITVRLASAPGSFITINITATGGLPPVVHIASPVPGSATAATQVTVTGTVQAATAVQVTVNGQPATVGAGNSYEATVSLGAEGPNALEVVASDAQGRIGRATRTILRDTSPPVLTVAAPQDGLITGQTSVTVIGTVTDLSPVTVDANGVPLVQDTLGGFAGIVTLAEGANVITVTGTDAAGNASTVVRIVTRDTQPPILTVAEPQDGATTTAEAVTVSGTVEDLTTVTVMANGLGLPVLGDGSFTGQVPVALGGNSITVTATDVVGHGSVATRTVTRLVAGPPDPIAVATPIIPTEASLLEETTAFLYTGANPIQTGVAPGTIDLVRAAVLRGRVLDVQLNPLDGVQVTVVDHPELGATETRSDGRFDLAVNGGGTLVLDFDKAGYLPAQRRLEVPWQTYTLPDDVVLLQADSVVTVVDLTSTEVQVARGSVQQDEDGARQATVFVEPGTGATLRFPDGTTQPLTSLALRATEFTVGDNGPAAMPAELPPASQYTYAVQLTADEQLAAGPGAVIEFSQPVPLYVENFLSFPVGTAVPVGVYDPTAANWLPEPNGVVLKVVGTDGLGRALLDINGDGVPDSDSLLAFNGIDPLERIRLAGTYPVGSELWRVNIIETLPHDLNWPFTLVGGTAPAGDVDGPCTDREADVLRCTLQVQTAFQAVGIVGSPFTLNYASDRTAGNVAERELVVELVGDTVPPFLERVDLQIDIAGRRFEASFVPEPNLSFTFTWDGLDGYGRKVQATQPAHVRIGYLYPVLYRTPASAVASFGQPCLASPCTLAAEVLSETRALRRVWQDIQTTLGGFDAAGAGFGGFTLDAQHAYDPIGGTLYRGDGTRRAAASLAEQVSRFAGTGNIGPASDPTTNGVPATQSIITFPNGIAVGPDGSVYFADAGRHRVRRVAPDGIISTVAGTGVAGFLGDGGPATAARLSFPSWLALGPDGSLFVYDQNNVRVRRVAPDGIITTYAGNGAFGFGGDGGPATAATLRLSVPGGIGVGPDGSVYIADAGNHRIRRVDPDGSITTFAGNAGICFGSPSQYATVCGEGIPAAQATLRSPGPLTLGPDGSVYFFQGGTGTIKGKIRRVTPDGLIHTVAGGEGDYLAFTDGGPARQVALLSVNGMAVGPDGTIYATHASSNIGIGGVVIPPMNNVVLIRPDGRLHRLAGTGGFPVGGDGGGALQATMDVVRGVAVLQDGSVLFADRGEVRRIRPALPGVFAGTTVIASEDASELYVFSPAGRILLTLSAQTGDTLARYAYNSLRQLVSITDRDGRTTVVERDAAGRITGILSPSGDRTIVALDAAGLVQALQPAGRPPFGFQLDSDGRLLAARSPAGDTVAYAYDGAGQMTGATGSAGSWTSSASGDLAGRQVQFSTGGVLSGGINVVPSAGGSVLTAAAALPGGLVAESRTEADGRVVTTLPFGTVVTSTPLADPRFGTATVTGAIEVTQTPSGLARNARSVRSVTVNPSNNALLTQTDSLVVNGLAATEVFDRANLRITRRTMAGRLLVLDVDAKGRVLQMSPPGAQALVNVYDSLGRLISAARGPRSEQRTYHPDGLLATVTNALGERDSMFYDAGRLARRVGRGGRVAALQYDSAGHLISISPPGRPAHRFTYTAAGHLTSYEPPAVGSETGLVRYLYDADSRLTTILRPDSINTAVTYDSAGRRASVGGPDGAFTFEYHAMTGNPSLATAPGGISLLYDYDGHLPTGFHWLGAVSDSVTLGYDDGFRVISQNIAGQSFAFTYDADGLPTQAGTLQIVRDALTGRVAELRLGSVVTARQYNQFGEVVDVSTTVDGDPLLRIVDSLDLLGRRVRRTEMLESDTVVLVYAYDATGRLESVTRNGSMVAQYDYDENGNLTVVARPSGTFAATYDGQDRLQGFGGIDYIYTAGGDLSRRIAGEDTTTYHYDAFNNLLAVTLPTGSTIAYLVDPANRRVGRRVDGMMDRQFLYSGSQLVAELDGAGQVVSRFVFGENRFVPDYMVRGDTSYRLVSEPSGTVRLVLNAVTGVVAQRLDYDAYGNVEVDTRPGFQPFGFKGGLYDPATNLTRIGARDYDPSTGRWTTRDPTLFGGDVNLYGYALGDPVNITDPSGASPLAELALTIAVSGVLDVAIGGARGAVGSGGAFGIASGMLSASAKLALFANSEEVHAALESRRAVDVLLDVWNRGSESPYIEDAIAEAMQYNQELVAVVANKAVRVAIGSWPASYPLGRAGEIVVRCMLGAAWESRTTWTQTGDGVEDRAAALLKTCVLSPALQYLNRGAGQALYDAIWNSGRTEIILRGVPYH